MRAWFEMVEFVSKTGLGTMQLMRLLTFGAGGVDFRVIDARRNFLGFVVWYPVILTLHRFFIGISRAVVNHLDGEGTALDNLVWSAGALPKRRRLAHAVRDRAFLPGSHLGGLRFNRGPSTPFWGVEACSLPSRRPNPIPAIPPCVVRTHILYGAPTMEETV